MIPGTEHTIAKGTPIILPIHAIQNDPIYYANPMQFDPERFAASTRRDHHHHTMPLYVPFGAGPRVCIGQKLGHLQTKVGLAMVLRGHAFQLGGNTAEGKELEMCKQNVLLCSVGGVQLKVVRRDQST